MSLDIEKRKRPGGKMKNWAKDWHGISRHASEENLKKS